MWGGVVANREPGSYIIIISKLRIAWEIHVYAVSASKNPEKMNFFGELSKTCFLSADTYSEHGVSPIAEGVEFLLFFGLGCRKNNDILGIYFVRNNCVFSDAPELVQNKIPKKLLFWGIFPDVFLIIFPFPGYVFTLCFLGGPRCLPAKRVFFGRQKNVRKMTFFRVRQYGGFWLQHSHCGDGYHIFPPTGLNLESAEISTSKLANPKQQMSKSIQQFLKCILISSPLVRCKWPTQVGTLGTLWWG